MAKYLRRFRIQEGEALFKLLVNACDPFLKGSLILLTVLAIDWFEGNKIRMCVFVKFKLSEQVYDIKSNQSMILLNKLAGPNEIQMLSLVCNLKVMELLERYSN